MLKHEYDLKAVTATTVVVAGTIRNHGIYKYLVQEGPHRGELTRIPVIVKSGR